ncbi:hypothetical protein [Qipengyuania flava]|uniref:hypothetical protein n=1 Tax=Qipengyuania flava TaxID=192812 RepID=UPI003BAEFA11
MDGENNHLLHELRNAQQQVQSLQSLLAKAADDLDTLPMPNATPRRWHLPANAPRNTGKLPRASEILPTSMMRGDSV